MMDRAMSKEPEPEAEAPETPVWDDDEFIARVREQAEARGMSLRDVSTKAGLAPDYFVKRRGSDAGRNIVMIVKLARALDVPVSVLVDPLPTPSPAEVDQVKLDRLAMAANVAAHLYVALDARKAAIPDDVDADELLQMLMRFVRPPLTRPTNKRP
jgi:transcriptional regulator with XRE-family HTH domain